MLLEFALGKGGEGKEDEKAVNVAIGINQSLVRGSSPRAATDRDEVHCLENT